MFAVARKIIQNCYFDRYFRSKLMSILINAKRCCMNLVTIIAYFTFIFSNSNVQLFDRAYVRRRSNVFSKREMSKD